MLDSERSSRPLRKFSGREGDFPEWDADFETWCVRKGFDKHMLRNDPRERQRVWASYRVTRMDDPSGSIGDCSSSDDGAANLAQGGATEGLCEQVKALAESLDVVRKAMGIDP